MPATKIQRQQAHLKAVTQQDWQGTRCLTGQRAHELNSEYARRNTGGQTRSALNLRGGLGRAGDPAGARLVHVEALCSWKHAVQAVALHHRQLVVHVGKASGTLVPGLR
jgi:hypothetical protein